MSKHTPGPWHVVISDNGTPFIQHENGVDWTDIDDLSSRVCSMPAEITQGFNSLPNAKLMATAPELLEALEAAMAFIDSHVADPDITKEMRSSYHKFRSLNPEYLVAMAKGEV